MSERPATLDAFLADDRGTSSVEFLMITGLVVLPLMLLYGIFLRGLAREFEFVCFLFTQAAP